MKPILVLLEKAVWIYCIPLKYFKSQKSLLYSFRMELAKQEPLPNYFILL